jgi:small subunit ribosomal protein S21
MRPGREGMVIETVIQIKLKKGEAVERALRRLKKIMDKEGMMKQLRATRYYEKPSEKKRRKSARARSRVLSGR